MYCRLKPILYQSTALFSLFGNWLCLLFSSDRDIRAFDLNSDILKSANRSDERVETSAFKPSELPMSQPEYPLSLFELPLLLFYRCLHRRERRGSGDHCWVSRLQHPVHCWSLWAICRNGEFPFREKKVFTYQLWFITISAIIAVRFILCNFSVLKLARK